MTEVNNVDDITKQSNANNTDTDKNNQQQQPNNTGSKQVVLGCDRNQDDEVYQATVATVLEQAGYTVEKLAIEPNAYASYSYESKAKGKIGIYLIAAGTYSIGDATYGNTNFDYNYFGIRPECSPNWDVEDFDTKPIGSDPDTKGGVTDKIAGHTFKEINEIVKARSMCVTGKDAAEMGKNLVAAMGGAVQGGSNSDGGASAVLIPDKTFYGLIKQMMGAVDATFIVANNMAYLLSFKDIYEYRNQFDEFIPKIERKNVLQDSITKNWTSNGFYNAVEVKYADGIVKYQNDALVKQYGENVFYYEFPEDDEETAKAKADALLAAHIRDYSTDIHLSIFYDENITEGSWVKVHKSITEISGKTRREIQQEELKQQGQTISTKHKGITIENLVEKVIKEDNITKKIQTITDETGESYDVEVSDEKYELFFVQAYTCRWDKQNSLIMDLELKYGPDTPEDPVNATIATGGGTTTTTGGNYGNDAFTIEDICVANNEMVMGSYEGGSQVQQVKELINGKYAPEPSDYQPRANKNSNYAKKYSKMKSPAEVYAAFRSEYRYSLYCDNCTCWKNATDFYDNAGKRANCGDTACLLKVFFDCIGVPSCGVHINGHYFNAIQINGTWEIIDGVRLENQTCNFPDGSGYSFGNPCPCDDYPGGGSCSTC